MNVLQVKFPLQQSSVSSRSKNELSDSRGFRKRSNIAEMSSRRKMVQDQMISRINSDRPKNGSCIRIKRPEGAQPPAIQINAPQVAPTETLVQQKSHRVSLNSSIDDDFEHSNRQLQIEVQTLAPPPSFHTNLQSKSQRKLYEEKGMHQFQFTSLSRLGPSISPKPKQPDIHGRNTFYDDESTTVYQNNILKSILTIKRNAVLEEMSNTSKSTKIRTQATDRNTSMPRIKDQPPEFSYFRVLKLPYHWNDNYYQTQQLLREAKQQSTQHEHHAGPPKTQVKEGARSRHFRYGELMNNEIVQIQAKKEQAIRLADDRLRESPKLFYGDLIQPQRPKAQQQNEENERFDEPDVPQPDMDDYFHYYVQSQKRT